ncbi:hypothetical protein C2G38_2163549 [Gigaspora rosea]|uniref:Uncharacterized protein n=1 Tax=Gigaspora rosea TaxID=44941 RepID=A0A397VZ95_9GLOM|nr:hypothetical protein C2G38_2163549 [Gigaspora rosea]
MTNKDQKPNNGTVSQSEDNNSSYDNSKDTKSANSETDVSKQNLEYVGDNNNPSSDQNLDSNTSNDDFNNSSYDEHDSSTFDKDKHEDHKKEEALNIVEKSATPEKCKEIDIDKYTVDNKVKEIDLLNGTDKYTVDKVKEIDLLNGTDKYTVDNKVKEIVYKLQKDEGSIELDNSIRGNDILISIGILVAVIAIFIFYYEPVDSPIFRNLINTTNLLSRQLAELNMPASSVILGYRVTSKSLADIINRNKLSSENSVNVAQYLNQLGDKLSNSGEAIEKMYLTGNYALNEIVSELSTINDEISREKIITRHDSVYFDERYEKILKAITKLRNQFQITLNELDELYDLYSGTRHQLANGMKDVELFFDEITPELKEYHNMEKLKRNLGYLTQIMKKVPDFRSRISNILFEFNSHRSVLIGYRSEWVGLRRRKLVSPEDTKELDEMIQKLMNVIRIFAKKDLANTEKRIYIT